MEVVFNITNDLNQLHDEIIAGVPELAPVRDDQGDGTPVMEVSGLGTTVTLTIPDDTLPAVLTALDVVVAAHTPVPRVDPKIRVAALLTIGRDKWTDTQQKELIELLAGINQGDN